jgi:hypothetical protein
MRRVMIRPWSEIPNNVEGTEAWGRFETARKHVVTGPHVRMGVWESREPKASASTRIRFQFGECPPRDPLPR